MKQMSKISEEFSAALNFLLTKKFYGTAVKLAENVDTTDKYISQIRNGHRQASPDLQERIAEEMGFKHNDFLALGRMLLEDMPKKEVEQKASVLRQRPGTRPVNKDVSAPWGTFQQTNHDQATGHQIGHAQQVHHTTGQPLPDDVHELAILLRDYAPQKFKNEMRERLLNIKKAVDGQ